MIFMRALAWGLVLLSSIGQAARTPSQVQSTANPAETADELVGLWNAEKRFGTGAHGPLIIQKAGAGFIAMMAGRTIPVRIE